MVSYDEVAQYASDHANDPLNLAKTITAWIYTCRYPFGDPTGQGRKASLATIEDLETTLFGACGTMRELMASILDEADIPTRRVNFWDVPVQGSHTALEALIDGKWMFFDPTVGIYFESTAGGSPLSIQEARAQWPDVIVRAASGLTGWSGTLIEPASIDLATVYADHPDPFFENPALAGLGQTNTIAAEIRSVILGSGTTVYINGVETRAGDGPRSVVTEYDRPAGYTYKQYSKYYGTLGRYDWDIKERSYDSAGRLDSQWTSYDNDSMIVFLDWDQADQYAWSWQEVQVAKHFYRDFAELRNDDLSGYIQDLDPLNYTALNSIEVTFGPGGTVEETRAVYDDGRSLVIDWALQPSVSGGPTINGTTDSDVLRGDAAANSLFGFGGPDHMEGLGGNDTYYVFNPADFVFENVGAGVDTVNSTVSFALPRYVEKLYLVGDAYRGVGNEYNNYIQGNGLDNRLDGLRGNDTIFGGSGNDTIVGGPGGDLIDGGRGIDLLYGNAGADVFRWRSLLDTSPSSGTADLIRDFSRSDRDRIDVSQIDADATRAGIQNFKFVTTGFNAPGQICYNLKNGNTIILLNTDNDATPEAAIQVYGARVVTSDWFIV
jgi:Ca2+-binding RTX toxin-like protein